MAETIWQGGVEGTEGDPTVVGNWSNGLPGGKDVLVVSGSQNMDGANLSGGTAWTSLHVGPEYTGTIGSPSAFLRIKCDDALIFQGQNNAYIDVSTQALPLLKVRSNSASNGLHFKTGDTGGTLDTDVLWLQQGNVWVEAGLIVEANMESWDLIASDANLTLTAGTITLLNKQGGTFTQDGGTCTLLHNRLGASTINAGTLTAGDMAAGLVKWETTVTLVNFDTWGGKFDASGDERAKTITNLSMHGDAEIDIDNGRDNITITNDIQAFGRKDPKQGPLAV